MLASAQVGNAPQIGDSRYYSDPWVRFGRSNLYPEFVRALADNCAPLGACVERFAQYVAGDYVRFYTEGDKDKVEHKEAARKWKELLQDTSEDELLYATALDRALLNTHAWQVLYDGTGMPARVLHLDVSRFRSGRKVDGIVKTGYWSSDWVRYKQDDYKPVELPMWGQPNNGKPVVIYARTYKQGRDYYGEPHWMAAMSDAEVLTRIPRFNLTQIDTGFRPGVHAHLTTNRDDASVDEIDENFEMVYTGENGKAYVLTVGSEKETLQITKLERGDHAGELDATRKVSKEEIYHSYGIPPILMGVNINTGLSGQGLAIEETLQMFNNTMVYPHQKPIVQSITKILNACGIEGFYAEIESIVPFEPAKDPVMARQAFIAATTVNEYREANGMEPFTDERGDRLLCDALKGAGNLDPNTDA